MPALTIVAWIAVILGFLTAVIILVDEIAHPQRIAIVAYLLLPPPPKANSIVFWFMMQIGTVFRC